MNNEELDKLSFKIENEIHTQHAITDRLFDEIKAVVESNPDILKPFNIRDSRIKSVTELNPLSFKMFQYLVAVLDEVFPEVRSKFTQHIGNVVLIKAFKFFPDNTEIFIAYAIRRILDDREGFIKECYEDKVMNVTNKSTIAGNLLSYLMIMVFVGLFAFICFKLYDEKLNEKSKKNENKEKEKSKKDNDKYWLNKKNFKEELKSVKERLKSKYQIA